MIDHALYLFDLIQLYLQFYIGNESDLSFEFIIQSFCQADFLYNFYQIMSDTIYNDLKEQGLILSEGVEIGFPPIRAPKPGLLGQLASYVYPEIKFQNLQYDLIIIPVLSNCFVIGRCNTLMCYKYEIQAKTGKSVISKPNINNLSFKIQKIHICDNKYLNDRGEIPFIVQSGKHLALYYVDLKQSKIIYRDYLSFSSVRSVRFICEKEFLVMSSDYYIHHIVIQSGKLKEKSKFHADLKIQSEEVIQQIDILGNIDEEQDSIVCLFYYLKLKGNQNAQILKVKEYLRDVDGKITPKTDYNILNTQHSVVLTENYQIMSFDSYYCIVIKHQILILKKKFDRYLFIDNIMQKIGGNTLKLHSKGIVTSHSGNSMQVNCILFNDPKCYSKLLDNIQIPSQVSQGFLMTWPFKNEKQSSLMFVFKKQKRLVFFNLIKMDPNTKMVMVVQKTPKEKITIVQQIAVNLGINKKDFYLNQWAYSKRQIADIYQFLLPCCDIHSIKKQLRMTMRRKKIQVSQILKILQKLGRIIKDQLKTNLSQNALKEYIKNDFLLRKIKLKQACKKLDHRELDKVYSSSLIDMFVQIVKNDLYPSEKQLDPLHAMVEAPLKEETNLKHVFQQFRMMILENYKSFLIKFISQFTSQQIVNVIKNYSFLLPIYQYKPKLIIHQPDYMTEVELNQTILNSSKTQEQWFSTMTSIQFARQLSKQRIQKELHDYYPNSKISQGINTLINSQYGVKEKLHKHGLISCTMVEYKEKLKEIEGIKLYLKVCEHVNQYNLIENTDADLSKQIVEIFRLNNNLQKQAYQTVKLYTSMHRFMLKNSFFEKKVMTAQQLIQLTSEDLVALFFLQNRQRKEFIFREFRDLFVDLYQGPSQFNAVIDRFINSENCSRIQLQIFINQIKNKGEQFQIDNQELIELIIDGFCKKLEVREDMDTMRFLQIMGEIELSKNLAMKISKVFQVRSCLNIFHVFNCEKESYFNILKYEQDHHIFKLLLDTYFNQGIKKDYIRIQNEEISLDFCRNMLTVLLYLQQNVYYDVTERQLLLTYGQVLIEWKQFQVIKGIIYDEAVLEKLDIEREPFINDLIKKTLDKIYMDLEITYDPQTKQQIRSILDIYEQQNEIKTQQFAKLQLVQIFEGWGTVVHTQDIFLIMYQWTEGNRAQFIEDLVNEYSSYLKFDVLQQVYRYMQMASGKFSDDIDVENEEFVNFSLYYAEKLLEEEKYEEIVKILAFVKSMHEVTPVSYALLSQTFLRCLLIKFGTQDTKDIGRQSIQYFTQYFLVDQKIQQVFESNLDAAVFQYKSVQREGIIPINSAFCFRKQPVSIQLDLLWELASSIYIEKGSKLETLYYSYYFLIMIFRNPQNGFFKNHKIKFNLQVLTDLLFKLQGKIDENTDLWAINTYSLFKKFLKGLYLQGLTRIKQVNSQLFKTFKNDDSHLDAIKTRLREDKQNNSQLLKCIGKVQNYLSAYKAVRKTQKQLRYQKLKALKDQPQQQQQVPQMEPQPQNNSGFGVTLNLKRITERKNNISRESNISGFLISQKEILERIYEQQNEEKNKNRKNVRNKITGEFFLPTLMNSSAKHSVIVAIQKYIQNQELDKLRQFSPEDLIQACENIYNTPRMDFHQMISILQELNIVDSKKIKVCRLCKAYSNQNSILSSDELKKMLPFNYLVQAAQSDSQQFKERMYMVMRFSFAALIENKDDDFIKHIAKFIGNILQDNNYIGRFYIDVVILSGKKTLDAESIIRISITMHILRQYSHEVRAYLTNILQAFKDNPELPKIKINLLMCLQDIKEEELQKYIKDY